ncbi:MAG: hypothetical protein C5B59_20410 [Bacteroidetes bacterium]|nr:MAG: hypothetical protein C5B59_20410 [Bacteroidota bacterium]
MKKPLYFILVSFIFFSCRSTELVYISVQAPAPVTIPPYIKSVGLVNRTLVSDQSKPIDVVDKIFSLEGPNLDKEGAQATITGLGDELQRNNRFTDIKNLANANLRTNTPGLFPAPLSWDVVEKICRDNNTDAIFVLEMFDTDSKINYAINPSNMTTALGRVPIVDPQATMRTLVKTGWRIYDPSTKLILDEFPISREISYTARGLNPAVAAQGLVARKDAVKEAGNQVGQAYALRIVPIWLRVNRDYFVRGSDNFRIARRKAQTGNWNEAADLWQKETTSPSKKTAGRACYNMAIISEINGDLDKAVEWAQRSYENYNNHLALHYVKILQQRQANNEVLKDQQPNP